MDALELRTLLRHIVGAAGIGGVVIVTTGCPSETCTTTKEQYEAFVPSDATVSGPVVEVRKQLARSCMTTCEQLFPNAEILDCSESLTEGGVFVRCDAELYRCDPYILPIRGGRPARDFVPRTEPGEDLAAWFTHLAEIESASVPSFLELARDLGRHGFSDEHARDARRFAEDERRHARMMRALARDARGGSCRPVPRPPVPPVRPPMTLLELAVANATEGCVDELFAAALVTWTAAHARSNAHRAIFARVARDETRHAALALVLDRAIDARFEPAERRLVEAERVRARRALEDRLVVRGRLIDAGIVPSARVQREILSGLREHVWS